MTGPRRRNPDLRVLPGARADGSRVDGGRVDGGRVDGGRAGSARGNEVSGQRDGFWPREAREGSLRDTSLRDSAPDLGATALALPGLSDAAPSESEADVRKLPVSARVPVMRATLEHLGDAQLVALTRAGDRHAFEALYRRHAAFALNLAVRIQGRLGDAEDVVHDAFLRAHQLLDRLRDDASFRGWLGSIVVSLVRSRLRRARLLGTLGLTSAEPIDLDALAAESAGPDTRALLAQIYGVLRKMPVDHRIAWTLRYVERHSLPDVATMAGCSLATAKRRIAAAQSQLDVVLGDEGDGAERGVALADARAEEEGGGDDDG